MISLQTLALPLKSFHLRSHQVYIALLVALLLSDSCSLQKNTATPNTPIESKNKKSSLGHIGTTSSPNTSDKKLIVTYQEKYASILGGPVEVNNLALFQFMDEWINAPYKYGGNSTKGVDCSRLSIRLMENVYQKNVIGNSADILKQCSPISKTQLKEGDLVFFKINSNTVSHMGVFIANNKFIHSTTQAGVIVSDLEDAYYRRYFYAAGRVK